MQESNANQPVTERLCQERHKHVQAIQEDLKLINGKLDEMHSTLTELSTDTRNHFDGHSKFWNRGYAVVICLVALSATVIALISLALNRKSSEQPTPKTSQRETQIVQYPRRYRSESG